MPLKQTSLPFLKPPISDLVPTIEHDHILEEHPTVPLLARDTHDLSSEALQKHRQIKTQNPKRKRGFQVGILDYYSVQENGEDNALLEYFDVDNDGETRDVARDPSESLDTENNKMPYQRSFGNKENIPPTLKRETSVVVADDPKLKVVTLQNGRFRKGCRTAVQNKTNSASSSSARCETPAFSNESAGLMMPDSRSLHGQDYTFKNTGNTPETLQHETGLVQKRSAAMTLVLENGRFRKQPWLTPNMSNTHELNNSKEVCVRRISMMRTCGAVGRGNCAAGRAPKPRLKASTKTNAKEGEPFEENALRPWDLDDDE